MRRLTLASCLAFLVVVAVVASAAAGTQVPIKGSLSTFLPANVTMVSCGVPGVSVPGNVEATGTMSHLGLVDDVIHTASCSINASGMLVMSGTADVIAANGDRLHNPSWTLVLDPATGAFHFTQLVLTGGTGRFANASGFFAGGGVFLPDGSGTFTVEGMISTVGSTN